MIPDVIIERAVELWCRALKHPFHDNGDDSEHGIFGGVLANINAGTARKPDHEEAIEKFREVLTTRLKFRRDHEGEIDPDGDGSTHPCFLPHSLTTDYSPCATLAQAAKEARIDNSQFSIKSSVCLFDDHTACHFGYRAEYTNHYPLPKNRWLLTSCTLTGVDKEIIIAAALEGKLALRIEVTL